jgi:hypothetical protein
VHALLLLSAAEVPQLSAALLQLQEADSVQFVEHYSHACLTGCNAPSLYLLQRCHNSVRALGYDDKTGLVVVAGDGSSSSSSSLGHGSSSSSGHGLTSADAFAAEGVTVSAWQLREQELTLKFSLGKPQV